MFSCMNIQYSIRFRASLIIIQIIKHFKCPESITLDILIIALTLFFNNMIASRPSKVHLTPRGSFIPEKVIIYPSFEGLKIVGFAKEKTSSHSQKLRNNDLKNIRLN